MGLFRGNFHLEELLNDFQIWGYFVEIFILEKNGKISRYGVILRTLSETVVRKEVIF